MNDSLMRWGFKDTAVVVLFGSQGLAVTAAASLRPVEFPSRAPAALYTRRAGPGVRGGAGDIGHTGLRASHSPPSPSPSVIDLESLASSDR